MNDEQEMVLELLGSLDRIAEALESIRDQLANKETVDDT